MPISTGRSTRRWSEVPLECVTPPPWMQGPLTSARRAPSPVAAGGPAMLEAVEKRLRQEVRQRHYSLRTEKAYVGWVRRFVAFHGYQDPVLLGSSAVRAYLTHL